MSIGMNYPIITSNLTSQLGVFGTADPWVANSSTPYPNGAYNPPGSLYEIPAPAQGGNTTLATTGGYGATTIVRYCLYKSSTNPAVVTGPAPVWYVDETFTTVSGAYADAYAADSCYCAGWMLPNSGTVTGVGLGTTAFTATILNNGGNGSYVFVAVQGFVPSAKIAAGSQGNFLYGATGNFTCAAIADGSSITAKGIGYVYSAVTSNIGDVLATVGYY
jgi:hypothetical protein